MASEPELVEKIWKLLQSLSVTEIWQIAGALSSVGAGLVWLTYKGTKMLVKRPRDQIVMGHDQRVVDELKQTIERMKAEIGQLRAQAQHIEGLKAALVTGIDDQAVWNFRSSSVPRDLLDRIHASGKKILTFANYKGGVGKTTMAANIGAYFAAHSKRVLFIDFDYQGSLSATVLRSAGRLDIQSHSDRLLTGALTSAELIGQSFFLPPDFPQVALVPAGNALSVQERRLELRWFLKMDDADPRFALVRLLSQPQVLDRFDVVIIDTPPRLGLATMNALAASTHFAVPTILDALSVENIGNLLENVDSLFRKGLNPNIKLAGIIGTMTEQLEARGRELDAIDSAFKRASEKWGESAYFFAATIPDTARFRDDAGRRIAYLDERQPNQRTRSQIDAIGDELVERIRV